MNNEEVAHILNEISQLLAICDENVFKVRSYERAAEAVAGLARPVAEYVAEGSLTTIPGVGQSIADVITELITTGQSSVHQQLLSSCPAGLLEMLRIPGFGPRKAGQVYRELGISSVAELEAAARAGKLRHLKGFGAKTEEKILAGIAQLHAGEERALLGDVLPVAEAFVEQLRTHPLVQQAEMAGSARRRKETIGDLDILATSEKPAEVTRWFAREGGLAHVELAGDTKVSGRTEAGLQVDLRVVPPHCYGAALQYFTGSMQHNVRLRERAQKQGLTISEYGVFEGEREAKGKQIAGETEESVYAAVGLPWIPPELREDRGEIAAAEEGRLPQLIALSDIRAELHLHTNASDGRFSIAEMAAACQELGYSYMAVTDHSAALVIANGLDAQRLRAQIDEIKALNQQLPDITILAGTEANIHTDGSVDVPEELWPELDIVIGAIHSGFSKDADKMTERLVKAMKSGRIDILAHPTGRLLLSRQGYEIHIKQLIEAAAEYRVALEINANPLRLDLSDIHTRLAVENGALLSINTDAHSRDELSLMRYGVMTARRGWAEPKHVINTWPLEKLRAWLQERRRLF